MWFSSVWVNQLLHQSLAQHAEELIALHGGVERLHAPEDLLQLVQGAFALGAVGRAAGQGRHQRGVRRNAHRLRQLLTEHRHLVLKIFCAHKVGHQLVQQNQRRLLAEHLQHEVASGRAAAKVMLLHLRVDAELLGERAPRRLALQRVGILAHEACDAHLGQRVQPRTLQRLAHQRGVPILHPVPKQVVQTNQRVRLAPAKRRLELNHRVAHAACQPLRYRCQQVHQSLRGVGLLEEVCGVAILQRCAPMQHIRQVRRENRFVQLVAQDVLARLNHLVPCTHDDLHTIIPIPAQDLLSSPEGVRKIAPAAWFEAYSQGHGF
jgi:hypothetical protein